eukprot:gene37998-59646_t
MRPVAPLCGARPPDVWVNVTIPAGGGGADVKVMVPLSARPDDVCAWDAVVPHAAAGAAPDTAACTAVWRAGAPNTAVGIAGVAWAPAQPGSAMFPALTLAAKKEQEVCRSHGHHHAPWYSSYDCRVICLTYDDADRLKRSHRALIVLRCMAVHCAGLMSVLRRVYTDRNEQLRAGEGGAAAALTQQARDAHDLARQAVEERWRDAETHQDERQQWAHERQELLSTAQWYEEQLAPLREAAASTALPPLPAATCAAARVPGHAVVHAESARSVSAGSAAPRAELPPGK